MEAGVKRGLLLIFALVLLLRIPFLNQAVQGDDHIYLTAAAHALIDPLHPNHTSYVFRGREVDLRGQPHPPLDGWILAGLLAVCGEVKEVPFHAFYTLFSLIAAVSMYSLARRFSPHPVWATLLFLAVPAFVVNGNSLETDVPFLAFWMAAVALYLADRLWLAGVCIVLASMTAYQAILLTPILFFAPKPRRWVLLLLPAITIAAWQIFERASTGALPATVLTGYLTIYQTLEAKLRSAAMLAIHSWFLVFPLLLPPALVLAWRKRREPDTRFLLLWAAIFLAGAMVIFFAGSARYLLPMAAPVALLASRLHPRWLAAGFALQMALSVGMAVVNYQHWDAYRVYAASLPEGGRIWVDGEWGLRHYVEARGGLPLTKTQTLRPGDLIVSSELGKAVDIHAPVTLVRKVFEIRPEIPLRLIGLETDSGYSSASRGLWPFGVSTGPIDRVSTLKVGERHATREYLTMDAPDAGEQIASGVWAHDHWMSGSAVLVLKSPVEAMPLSATVYIPDNAPARKVTLLLDGKEVASQSYTKPGLYMLVSAVPVRPAGAVATLEVDVDKTFTAPPDTRELGAVLVGAGFKPVVP